MEPATASDLLGVPLDAGPDEVRRAFLRLLRRHHPDVAGGDAATTRALIEAHRTLTASFWARRTTTAVVQRAQNDTLVLELPPDEAFLRLLDAGADLGEVTYVDAEAGLLEVIVAFDDGRTASLVVTVQGRAATGTTEAFCTLEALGHGDPPDVAIVVAALAEGLTGRG